MNILEDDIRIEKELPPHMKSLDIKAIGSQVYYPISHVVEKTYRTCYKYGNNYLALQITDADIPKEATSDDYIKIVLPRLLRNGVVHFLGYGNRLGFDPLPSDIQVIKLPCLSSFE